MAAVEVLAKVTPMTVTLISMTTDHPTDMAMSQDLLLGTPTPPAERQGCHTTFIDLDPNMATTRGQQWITPTAPTPSTPTR